MTVCRMTRSMVKVRGQYLKLIGAGFFIFVLVFVSCDFGVGSK